MVISNKRNSTGHPRKNHARENAVRTDGGFLIQIGHRTTLANLDDVQRITADSGPNIDRKAAMLSLALGDDHIRRMITTESSSRITETSPPASLVTSPCSCQSPHMYQETTSLLPAVVSTGHQYFGKTTRLQSKRIIANSGLYGHEVVRMDTVWIEIKAEDARF